MGPASVIGYAEPYLENSIRVGERPKIEISQKYTSEASKKVY